MQDKREVIDEYQAYIDYQYLVDNAYFLVKYPLNYIEFVNLTPELEKIAEEQTNELIFSYIDIIHKNFDYDVTSTTNTKNKKLIIIENDPDQSGYYSCKYIAHRVLLISFLPFVTYE